MTARLEVLRNRDFRLFLVGRLLATLAVQMQTVAVGWQVYSVTHDPLDLGLIGFSQFLPFIVLILPAGQMADRRDRRRILTGCFAIECVCALGLLAFAVRGIDSAWPVFAVMFLFGAARAFAMPTGQALLPNLVPREQFGTAVALNTSTWQVATIAGPAIGGILYVAGPATVYATVAVLLAAATAMTFTLRSGGDSGLSARAADARRAALGSALRLAAPAGARRDLAGPVRRAVRRRHGAAAGLCGRRAARRSRRARRAACGARRRCCDLWRGIVAGADHAVTWAAGCSAACWRSASPRSSSVSRAASPCRWWR